MWSGSATVKGVIHPPRTPFPGGALGIVWREKPT